MCIDDVVEAYLRCRNDFRSFSQSDNVVLGTKTSVPQLLEVELRVYGQDPARYPVRFSDSPPCYIFGIYVDITAIKKDMGTENVPEIRAGDDGPLDPVPAMTGW